MNEQKKQNQADEIVDSTIEQQLETLDLEALEEATGGGKSFRVAVDRGAVTLAYGEPRSAF
jgi:hypothetical protein